MTFGSKSKQNGLSLVGLIFVLAILAMIAVLAMKVVPTVIEYNSIRKAIVVARGAGETVRDIQSSFDKQAEVGYIESITGKDLEITKNGGDIDVSFAYQKKIPLFGPASLVLDYAGTTAKTVAAKKTID
jgi:type II secretory pathway pseudopilin PulG